MSQHHLTVETIRGTKLKLVAGYDPRLYRFFLTVSKPDAEEHEVLYDSDTTYRGLPHIGDVEEQLEKLQIPFSEEHTFQQQHFEPDKPVVYNPKLLPLLCEILLEKDEPTDVPRNKIKFWDNEPLEPRD
jgi:hypothetical protein